MIIIIPIAGIIFMIYIRLVEEKKLEKRFGKKYLEYKRKTPFIIPRIKK